MKLEDAKRLYALGGEAKEIILPYFSERELNNSRIVKFEDVPEKIGAAIMFQSKFATVEQAFAFADAAAKLSMVHWYAVEGWVADWTDSDQEKFVVVRDNVVRDNEGLSVYTQRLKFGHFPFPNREMAEESIKTHKSLWEAFYLIPKN